MDAGNSASLQLTGSMTLSAWFMIIANGVDDNDIVTKAKNISGFGWQLKTSIDCGPRTIAVRISHDGGTSTERCGSTTLSLNTWYHATGVYDASALTMDVYLNGVLNNGTLSGTIPSLQDDSADIVEIGCRVATVAASCKNTPGSSNIFIGLIDEVRVYNRALTPDEIERLYNMGASTFNAPQTSKLTNGLVGYWTFDGRDTNTTTNHTADLSGNGNVGTLTNGPVPTVGKLGQALNFDGVNDYVEVGNPTSLRLTGSATWAGLTH